MNDLEALVLLTTIPYLGSVKIRLLIQHFGSASEAVKASLFDLAALPGFGPKTLDAWKQNIQTQKWRTQFDLASLHNVHIVPYTDACYPPLLLETSDYPLILYIKGHMPDSQTKSLAVIGTRQASLYGIEMARRIGKELAESGIVVVSGFARGVDTAAHEGALEAGQTIGVLGSGLGCLYPKENQRLAQKVIQQGALMSEYSFLTPPDRRLFPQRNRIVCGMTMGTVLIEAPLESGAMITAAQALNLKRPIFALPGRADSLNFKGNHQLIKQGQAKLIEKTEDILDYFDLGYSLLKSRSIPNFQPVLEPDEALIVKQMPDEELSIEQLVAKTKLPISKLNVLLVSLVLKKIIKEFPGKIYKKI